MITGGGGASDVRQRGNSTANRVVVAGGAGGTGSGNRGGNGGGLEGASFDSNKGGTQTSGGANGIGGAGAFEAGGGGGGYFGGLGNNAYRGKFIHLLCSTAFTQ